jgi:hypothetical protein
MRAFLLCLGLSVAIADESLPSPAPSSGASLSPPCRTVADCWLDDAGHAIARPRKFRGKPIPRGDCGSRINWLRHRLMCVEGRCTAADIGDRC